MTMAAPTLTARQLVQSMPEPFRDALLSELLATAGSPLSDADRAYLSLAPEMRTALMRPYLDLNLNDTLTDAEVDSLTNPAAVP